MPDNTPDTYTRITSHGMTSFRLNEQRFTLSINSQAYCHRGSLLAVHPMRPTAQYLVRTGALGMDTRKDGRIIVVGTMISLGSAGMKISPGGRGR